MGLFKKKKEKANVTQSNKNRFVGFALLSDANWDREKLMDDLQAQWNICIEEVNKKQDDTVVFQVGKMIAVIG